MTTAKEVSKEDRTAEEDRMNWRHSLCVGAPLSLPATGMSSAATELNLFLFIAEITMTAVCHTPMPQVNTTQVSSISTFCPLS